MGKISVPGNLLSYQDIYALYLVGPSFQKLTSGILGMFEGSGITSPLSCSLFNVTYKGYISTKVKLWDNVNLCVHGQPGCGKKGWGLESQHWGSTLNFQKKRVCRTMTTLTPHTTESNTKKCSNTDDRHHWRLMEEADFEANHKGLMIHLWNM